MGNRLGHAGVTPLASGGERYPLEEMRVLDLSCNLPGVYATELLVDAGADVVKVEPEGETSQRKENL